MRICLFFLALAAFPSLSHAHLRCELAAASDPAQPNYYKTTVATIPFKDGEETPLVHLVFVKKDWTAIQMTMDEYNARPHRKDLDGLNYFLFERMEGGMFSIVFGDVDFRRPAGRERKPVAETQNAGPVNLMAMDRSLWAICTREK